MCCVQGVWQPGGHGGGELGSGAELHGGGDLRRAGLADGGDRGSRERGGMGGGAHTHPGPPPQHLSSPALPTPPFPDPPQAYQCGQITAAIEQGAGQFL